MQTLSTLSELHRKTGTEVDDGGADEETSSHDTHVLSRAVSLTSARSLLH